MLGEEVVVDTLTGKFTGIITEETATDRWIKQGKYQVVRQIRVRGEWETVLVSNSRCLSKDHE